MNAFCKLLSIALLAGVVVVSSAAESTIKKPGQLERFTGIVHRVPSNGVGLWMIGNRTFESDSFTTINTFEASATAGNCAVVILRMSRAVQIVFVDSINC
jgi:hypothetical protein